MSKSSKHFQFTTPVSITFFKGVMKGSQIVQVPFKTDNYGELVISGIAYGPDSYDFDEIIYRSDVDVKNGLPGCNVIGLLKVMGDGSLDEVDMITKPTLDHVAGLFGKSDTDFYTDTIQDFEQEEAA